MTRSGVVGSARSELPAAALPKPIRRSQPEQRESHVAVSDAPTSATEPKPELPQVRVKPLTRNRSIRVRVLSCDVDRVIFPSALRPARRLATTRPCGFARAALA